MLAQYLVPIVRNEFGGIEAGLENHQREPRRSTYRLTCAVANHSALGMVATLRVR